MKLVLSENHVDAPVGVFTVEKLSGAGSWIGGTAQFHFDVALADGAVGYAVAGEQARNPAHVVEVLNRMVEDQGYAAVVAALQDPRGLAIPPQ